MFKKSGTKIKLIAKILFWLGTACSILAGVGIMIGGLSVSVNGQAASVSGASGIVLGLLIIALGIVSSYISSLILHAYGELVDKTKDSNYLLTRIADHTKHLSVDVDKVVRDPGYAMPGLNNQPTGGEDKDSGSFAPSHRV